VREEYAYKKASLLWFVGWLSIAVGDFLDLSENIYGVCCYNLFHGDSFIYLEIYGIIL
jgi:hypothetical protein